MKKAPLVPSKAGLFKIVSLAVAVTFLSLQIGIAADNQINTQQPQQTQTNQPGVSVSTFNTLNQTAQDTISQANAIQQAQDNYFVDLTLANGTQMRVDNNGAIEYAVLTDGRIARGLSLQDSIPVAKNGIFTVENKDYSFSSYDEQGRLVVHSTTRWGKKTTYSYQKDGSTIVEYDGIVATYNSNSNLVSLKHPDGTITYYDDGFVSKIVSKDGTEYFYIKETQPDGTYLNKLTYAIAKNSTKTYFKEDGLVDKVEYANGIVSQYAYNGSDEATITTKKTVTVQVPTISFTNPTTLSNSSKAAQKDLSLKENSPYEIDFSVDNLSSELKVAFEGITEEVQYVTKTEAKRFLGVRVGKKKKTVTVVVNKTNPIEKTLTGLSPDKVYTLKLEEKGGSLSLYVYEKGSQKPLSTIAIGRYKAYGSKISFSVQNGSAKLGRTITQIITKSEDATETIKQSTEQIKADLKTKIDVIAFKHDRDGKILKYINFDGGELKYSGSEANISFPDKKLSDVTYSFDDKTKTTTVTRDGLIRKYNEKGQFEYAKLGDGTEVFYPSGVLSYINTKDENGSPIVVDKLTVDDNGKIVSARVNYADGGWRVYKDGVIVKQVIHNKGVAYYEGGKLKTFEGYSMSGGNVSNYTYETSPDGKKVMVEENLASGAITKFQDGNAVYKKNKNGTIGKYSYYSDGKCSESTTISPDGTSEHLRYAYKGDITYITDDLNKTLGYNKDGLLVQEVKQDGSIAEFIYDATKTKITGAIIKDRDGGYLNTLTYEIQKDTTIIKDDQGISNIYDKDGKLLYAETPDGTGYTETYFDDGKEQALAYIRLSSGRKLNYKDGKADSMDFTDGKTLSGSELQDYLNYHTNRCIKISPDIASKTEYDKNGKLVSSEKLDGNKYLYTYETSPDGKEVMVEENLTSGIISKFQNGNLIYEKEKDGTIKEYYYYPDGKRSVLVKISPDGSQERLTYTYKGDITYITDKAGKISEYNKDGLLIREVKQDGITTEFIYNYDKTQITSAVIRDKDGGYLDTVFYKKQEATTIVKDEQETSRIYDKYGKLLYVETPDGIGYTQDYFDDEKGEKIKEETLAYMRFSYGRKLNFKDGKADSMDFPVGKSLFGSELQSYLNFNANSINISPDIAFKIEYDANGELISVQKLDGTITVYDSGKVSFITDENGNLTTSYSYDEKGNLAAITMSDARKRLTSERVRIETQIAEAKTNALNELASKASSAEQDAVARVRTETASAIADVHSRLESTRAQLQQKINDLDGQKAYGRGKKQKSESLDNMHRQMDDLNAQEAAAISDIYNQAASAYSNIDAQLSSEVARMRNQIESDERNALSSLDVQGKELENELLRQEATPVMLHWYRQILGRDPSQDELNSSIAAAKGKGLFDLEVFKKDLLAQKEYTLKEAQKSSVIQNVNVFLANYMRSPPDEQQKLLASLGLSQSEIVALTQDNITDILNFLKGQNLHFGSSAFLALQDLISNSISSNKPSYQDLSTRALLIDILSGIITPQTKGELVLSLYALNKTSASYGVTAYALKLTEDNLADQVEKGKVIAHINGNHYVTVTKIAKEKDEENNEVTKVYYFEHNAGPNGELRSLSLDDFKSIFGGYILAIAKPIDNQKIISDNQAKLIRGAFFQFLMPFLNKIFEAAKNVITAIANTIKNIIVGIVTIIATAVKAVMIGIASVVRGIASALAFIGKGLFAGIKFVGTSLFKGLSLLGTKFFAGGLFGATAAKGSGILGFLSGIFNNTIIQGGLNFLISKGLKAIGLPDAVSNVAAAFISGAIQGLINPAAGAASLFQSVIQTGVRFAVMQGVSEVAKGLGLDGPIASILSIATGKLVGGDSFRQVFSQISGELAYYGVTKLGEKLGIDPRINQILGIPISATIAGITGDKTSKQIQDVIADGLKQGIVSMGIEAIAKNNHMNPIATSLATTIAAGAFEGVLSEGHNPVKGVIDIILRSVKSLPGSGRSNDPVYISKVLDFSSLIREKGFASALETYATSIFTREGVASIVASSGTIENHIKRMIAEGKAKPTIVRGQKALAVPTNADGSNYIIVSSDQQQLLGRKLDGFYEEGTYVVNKETGEFILKDGPQIVDSLDGSFAIANKRDGRYEEMGIYSEDKDIVITPANNRPIDVTYEGNTIIPRTATVEDLRTGTKETYEDGIRQSRETYAQSFRLKYDELEGAYEADPYESILEERYRSDGSLSSIHLMEKKKDIPHNNDSAQPPEPPDINGGEAILSLTPQELEKFLGNRIAGIPGSPTGPGINITFIPQAGGEVAYFAIGASKTGSIVQTSGSLKNDDKDSDKPGIISKVKDWVKGWFRNRSTAKEAWLNNDKTKIETGKDISIAEAIRRGKEGEDIFAGNKEQAEEIARAIGNGKQPIQEDPHGSTPEYKPHYHPNGREPHIHIWY